MLRKNALWVGALTLVLFVTSSGCSLPDIIGALDGPYYHISAGTNLYVTIKRNATEEMFYFTYVCLLNGGTQLECGKNTFAVTALTIEQNLEEPVKTLWNERIKYAFMPDEALDFMEALTNLSVRSDECLRISIRSGENWTTLDDSYAECSWGKDPIPDNGI